MEGEKEGERGSKDTQSFGECVERKSLFARSLFGDFVNGLGHDHFCTSSTKDSLRLGHNLHTVSAKPRGIKEKEQGEIGRGLTWDSTQRASCSERSVSSSMWDVAPRNTMVHASPTGTPAATRLEDEDLSVAGHT